MITDRTEADVTLAKTEVKNIWKGEEPTQAYFDGLKGCYTIADINRVESAVDTVQSELNAMGYIIDLETKTDWTHQDVFKQSDETRYINNISVLREVIEVFESTPTAPDTYKYYSKANDIEQIIVDLLQLIELIKKTWYYSNEIYSGEV